MEQVLGTDLTSWTIGPYHGSLPGPMRLSLKLDGEIIVSGEVESGFLHKGLEKSLELHLWHQSIAYADHLDPESSAYGELALCLAVEDIMEMKVPKRAQAIRVIVAELTRISAHFGYVARMARAVGSSNMLHYILRDREKVLDLLELLTGARFSLNFLRFGGVAADVTEGFMERVLEVCDLIRIRLKECNDLFSFNHAFLKRTSGIGRITRAQAERLGMTGPNARASGVDFDVRRAQSYSGYQDLDFEIPVHRESDGASGDCHSRFLIRLREITESVVILRQIVEKMPLGEFDTGRITREFSVLQGEAYARVESPRGLLGCYAVSDGSLKPARVQFRAPSVATLKSVPELIVGSRLEDLSVILASLDISMPEVDR